MAKSNMNALVGIVMGSESDWATMKPASDMLKDFGVPHEVKIVSAHRTPQAMLDYATSAADRGLAIIIAGAGGAAHLPGMLASATSLPVIGVPVNITKLEGKDSLLSILQMPKGVPVATVAIDNSANAALLAIRILAIDWSSSKKTLNPQALTKQIQNYRLRQAKKVATSNRKLR